MGKKHKSRAFVCSIIETILNSLAFWNWCGLNFQAPPCACRFAIERRGLGEKDSRELEHGNHIAKSAYLLHHLLERGKHPTYNYARMSAALELVLYFCDHHEKKKECPWLQVVLHFTYYLLAQKNESDHQLAQGAGNLSASKGAQCKSTPKFIESSACGVEQNGPLQIVQHGP